MNIEHIWLYILLTTLGAALLRVGITGRFYSVGRGGARGLVATINSLPVKIVFIVLGLGIFAWLMVDLYYTANGTAQTATAQATFNIAGPTSPNVITCGGNVPSGSCPNGPNSLGQPAINSGNPYPFLQFGGTTDNIGIQFIASANQPARYSSWVFKWVNKISDDNVTLTDSNGSPTISLGTGFDTNGTYPSFANITANATYDNPKYQLTPPCTEIKRSFDAQTFLMWNAGLTNPPSIDIPLGWLTWGFSGDARLNSGTWSINGTPSKYATGFTSSSSYPGWTSGHFNGTSPACP